eukprot:COSAG02_NODE_44674_length_364_cov_0.656604_2_plen_62_part_01
MAQLASDRRRFFAVGFAVLSRQVECLEWFEETLGFRMEQIFPADSPRIAVRFLICQLLGGST